MYKVLLLTWLCLFTPYINYSLSIEKAKQRSFDVDFHYTLTKHLLNTWIIERFGINLKSPLLKHYSVRISQNNDLLTIKLNNSTKNWSKSFHISVNQDYLSLDVYQNILKTLETHFALKTKDTRRKKIKEFSNLPYFLRHASIDTRPYTLKPPVRNNHIEICNKLISLAFVYEQSSFYTVEKLKSLASAEYILARYFIHLKSPKSEDFEGSIEDYQKFLETSLSSNLKHLEYLKDFLNISIGDKRSIKINNIYSKQFQKTINLLVTNDFTQDENWKLNLKTFRKSNTLVLHLMSKAGFKSSNFLKEYQILDSRYGTSVSLKTMLHQNLSIEATYKHYRGPAIMGELKKWHWDKKAVYPLSKKFHYSENNLDLLQREIAFIKSYTKKQDTRVQLQKNKDIKYYNLPAPTFSNLTLSMVYQFLLDDYTITKHLLPSTSQASSFDKNFRKFLKDDPLKFKFVESSQLTKNDYLIISQEFQKKPFAYSPKFWVEASQAFSKYPEFTKNILEYFVDNSKARADLSYYCLLLKQLLFNQKSLGNAQEFLSSLDNDVDFLLQLDPYDVVTQSIKMNLYPKSYDYKKSQKVFSFHTGFSALLRHQSKLITGVESENQSVSKEDDWLITAQKHSQNQEFDQASKYYYKWLQNNETSYATMRVNLAFIETLIAQNKIYQAKKNLIDVLYYRRPIINKSYASLQNKIKNKILEELILLSVLLKGGEGFEALSKFYVENNLPDRKNKVLQALQNIQPKPVSQHWIEGLRVGRITKNSMAETYGLQLGDVVIELNRQASQTPTRYFQLSQYFEVDKNSFEITVWRNNKKVYLQFPHTSSSKKLGFDYVPIQVRKFNSTEVADIRVNPQDHDWMYLDHIKPDSPAEKCGFRSHDQLFVANGYSVHDTYALVFRSQVENDLSFLLKRDGKWINLQCPTYLSAQDFKKYHVSYYDSKFGFKHHFISPSWLPPFPTQKIADISKKINDSKKNGEYSSNFKDGQPAVIAHYKNGFKDGDYKEWDYNDRFLYKHFNYKNGIWDGIQTLWRGKNLLEWVKNYKNGVLHGVVKTYHSNGKLQSLQTYKNGNLNGIEKQFTKSGSLHFECIYENNIQISSKQTSFTGEDNAIFSTTLRNSENIEIMHFNPKTNLPRRYSKLSLDKTGIKKRFFENGKVHTITHLLQGTAFKIETFLPTEEYLSTTFITNKNGKTIQRTIDKNQKQISIQIDNKKSGTFAIWAPCGEYIQFQKNFKNGIQQGPHTEFHDNGVIAESLTYEFGKKHGVLKKWHKNGQLAETANYKHGEIIGQQLQYTKQGQLKFDGFYKKGALITETSIQYTDQGGLLKKSITNKGRSRVTEYFEDTTTKKSILISAKPSPPIMFTYSRNAKLISESVYYPQSGQVSHKTSFQKDGSRIDETFYKSGVLKSRVKILGKKVINKEFFKE